MSENPFVLITQNQASGFVSPAESERELPLSLDRQLIKHPAATFLLRAQEHWPEYFIRSGDLLLVDRAASAYPGKLVLAIQDGQFCLARIYQGKRGLGFKNSRGQSGYQLWGIVSHVIHQWN